MSLSLNLLLLSLLSCAAIGCGDASEQQGAVVARDSAGVRIVESERATWPIPWEVSARPLLSIGSVEGNSDQLLDQVAGAVGLTGGRTVVANGGSLQLLFYDAEGKLLRRVGGRGGGPGEFQSLEWLARYGSDSLLALDVWNQRVSYYDADGNLGRSVRFEPDAQVPFPRTVGVFSDGSFLATKGLFNLGGDPPVRLFRTEEPLFRLASDGSTASQVGSYPGPESVMAQTGPRGGWERRGRPFGHRTALAAGGDRFYVADNATYEIRVYSATGQLLQLIRKATASVPIEPADIQAFEDSVLAVSDSRQRVQMNRLFAALPPPPPVYPAFAPEIHVDDESNVWVRETPRPDHQGWEWSVFSAAGAFLGTVNLPRGAQILDIGAEYILCLEHDELDVEYVRKYRLRRGSEAP